MVDGDTVDVECETLRDRIRLLRIDTPERGEAGYREAGAALAQMVRGRDVYLVFETPSQLERGSYKRVLAYLCVGDTNLNVEMVRLGWSSFWTKYGEGRFADEFRAAERGNRAPAGGVPRQPLQPPEGSTAP